jgi:hypothetical protein
MDGYTRRTSGGCGLIDARVGEVSGLRRHCPCHNNSGHTQVADRSLLHRTTGAARWLLLLENPHPPPKGTLPKTHAGLNYALPAPLRERKKKKPLLLASILLRSRLLLLLSTTPARRRPELWVEPV